MADEGVDGGLVVHDEMGPLHLEILKEMAHAISAIERASHDVVEAEARLSVVDHVLERCGKICRCRSHSEHQFRTSQAGRCP